MNDSHFWQLSGAAFSPLWWSWQALSQPVPDPWARHALAAALAVPVALLIDRLWGEPPVWMHPVVAMGRLLAAVGRRIAPREEHVRDWPRFALGAVAWCLLALLFFAIYAFIQWLLPPMPWWLAGGIRADRVPLVLQALRPTGLDASSSVERAPADKDLAAVAALVGAVRSWPNALP